MTAVEATFYTLLLLCFVCVLWEVLRAGTVNHLWNENTLKSYSLIFFPVLFCLYCILTLAQRECGKSLKTSNEFPFRVTKQHDCCIKWMTVWTVQNYKNIQTYNPGFNIVYGRLILHRLPALVLNLT